MTWLKMQALELGLAWIVGPVVVVVMQLLKRLVAVVEGLPAWQKRAVVVFLASVFTLLGQALGVDFGVTPESLSGLATLSEDTLKVAVASAFAMGLHWAKKALKK